MKKIFEDIPVYEWDDLDGKTLILRVTEDSGVKILCGFNPIDNVMYVLAENITR